MLLYCYRVNRLRITAGVCLLLLFQQGLSIAAFAQQASSPAQPAPGEVLVVKPGEEPMAMEIVVNEDFDKTPLTFAIRRLFASASLRRIGAPRVDVSLDPDAPPKPRGQHVDVNYRVNTRDVYGTVTAKIVNLPIEAALYQILKQARARMSPLSYQQDGGAWAIVPRPLPTVVPLALVEAERREWLAANPNAAAKENSQLPELIVQTGHSGTIDGLSFSPDKKYLASSGSEQTINIWNLRSRQIVHTLVGTIGPSAFSSDGKTLMSATGTQVMRWDVESGQGQPVKVPGGLVYFAAQGPDGKFATSSGDNTIRIWRGRGEIAEIYTEGAIYNVAFSPSGRFIVGFPAVSTASADDPRPRMDHVAIWTLNGQLYRDVQVKDDVQSVAFTPDGFTLAVGTVGSAVRIYDLRRNDPTDGFYTRRIIGANPALDNPGDQDRLSRSGYHAQVRLAFSPNGQLLAAAGDDNVVVVYNFGANGLSRRQTIPTGSETSSLAFKPDNQRLAIGARVDGKSPDKIKIWDVSTARTRLAFGFNTTTRDIDFLAFSPDKSALITGGGDELHLWNTAMTSPPRSLAASLPALLSPDGRLLATRSPAGSPLSVLVWDVTTGALRYKLRPKPKSAGTAKPMIRFHGEAPRAAPIAPAYDGQLQLCFSPDRKTLIAAGWAGHSIYTWNLETGEEFGEPFAGKHTFDYFGNDNYIPAHNKDINFLAMSGDARFLISRDVNGKMNIWDAAGRAIVKTVGEPAARPADPAAPAEAPPPVAEAPDPDAKAKPWDNFPPDGRGTPVVSPNSQGVQTIALFDINRILVYDLATGMPLLTVNAVGVPQFSPDGSLLGVPTGGSITMYETEGMTPAGTVPSTGGRFVFSHGGAAVACIIDKAVSVYHRSDSGEWPRNGNLRGHTTPVTSVEFSRDGSQLVTGSADSSVRLWDVRSHANLVNMVSLGDSEYFVSTPDHHYMASKGALPKVAFVTGNTPYAFEQFDLQLNRPDIVLKALGRASQATIDAAHSAYAKRVTHEGQAIGSEAPAIPTDHLPAISVVNENDLPDATPDSEVTFDLEIKANGSPAQTLDVLINDVPIYGAKGLPLADAEPAAAVSQSAEVSALSMAKAPGARASEPIQKRLTLTLTPRRNRIQISARSANGGESRRLTYEIDRQTAAAEPTLYIIAVGVSKYTHPEFPNLKFAAKDAQDIVAAFGGTIPGLPGAQTSAAKQAPQNTQSIPAKKQTPQASARPVAAARVAAVTPAKKLAASGRKTRQRTARSSAARRKPQYYTTPYTYTYTSNRRSPAVANYAAYLPRYNATEVSEFAEQPSYGTRYKEIKTFPFVQGESRAAILAVHDKLMESHPEDHVVLFIAGHGFLDPSNLDYYFAIHDTDPAHLPQTALSYADLEGILDGIPARQKLMLMDTCYSGEADLDPDADPAAGSAPTTQLAASAPPSVRARGGIVTVGKMRARGSSLVSVGASSNTFQLMRDLFTDLRRGSGTEIITAADGAQAAEESDDWNNGAFTRSVLQGLRTKAADANHDGKITVSELRNYVTQQVVELTGGLQKPTNRRDSLEFDFPLLIDR